MRFRFGVFDLDEQAGELRRAGAPVRIQPKPFELLCLLIRERDRVVGSDELMTTLWPDTIVSPASLNRAVSHARRAVGDTGRGLLLKSISRRGYRFVGDVIAIDADDDESRGSGASSNRSAGDAIPKRRASSVGPRSSEGERIFVGREDALARLEAAQAAVLQGGTRVVVVNGAAGIGKTRLTERFSKEAARRGLFVVTARCRDRDGSPAFWVWTQVMRGLINEPSLREALVGLVASGEVSELLPGLRSSTPDLIRDLGDPDVPDTDLPSEQQRFRAFDAALRALRTCAQIRPIVVVLEDIQWAGSGSLRLLEYIALEFDAAPLLLLATLRDEPRERGHPVDRTVALLRQQSRTDSIELAGLSRGEVGEFLKAAIGTDRSVPVDLVSELYARTEGIPFFVQEATRLLEERGDLARPEHIPRHGVTLPARAVDLIRRSIDAVSEGCLGLLGAGSVLGRDFTLRAATAVGETPRETALDLFDEAIRAGILEESESAAATYRFSHALFQDAIYEGLTPSRRARLHRAAAQRLEQQHAGALDPVLSELAHHHHRAIAVGKPERAFDFAIQAARQTERLMAWEQAALHYEQAVASFEHFDVVDPQRRVETLLALGEAHRLSGNRDRRIAAFEQAARVARALDSPEAFARAAVGLCDVSEWSAQTPESTEAIVEEALAGTNPADKHALARLTTRLGYLNVRDRARAEPFGREGVALARASQDPVALQESLYILHYIIAGPDSLDERAEFVGELMRAAQGCANRDAAVIALLDIACDGLMQGDLEKALSHRRLASDLGDPQPSPTMSWHTRVWDAGLALLQGRFAEAEQGMHDALLLGRRLSHPFALACFRGQLCVLDRDRGKDQTAIDLLAHTIHDKRLGATHWSTAVVGRAAAALGDLDRGRKLMDVLGESSFEDIARTIRWNGTVAEVAMLAAEVEALEYAAPLRELLSTAQDQHGLLPMPINYSGPLARPMAALSGLLGIADEARAFYDEALDSAAALGARPTLARIGLEAAPVLARAGDLASARDRLRESHAMALEIGMPRVAEDARKALERY